MHTADIKAAIQKSDFTQTQIAEEMGVSKTAVWLVIHGRSHSLRIAKRISEVTGHSIDDLWPGAYLDEAA
jgi:transcriptional regulator with XRE-family HTH domain